MSDPEYVLILLLEEKGGPLQQQAKLGRHMCLNPSFRGKRRARLPHPAQSRNSVSVYVLILLLEEKGGPQEFAQGLIQLIVLILLLEEKGGPTKRLAVVWCNSVLILLLEEIGGPLCQCSTPQITPS